MSDHIKHTSLAPSHSKQLIQILLLAFLYFATGKASFAIEVSNTIVSTLIFMPEGFALAATILLGRRVWPGILIGQFILALSSGIPWEIALGIGLTNSFEAVVGATLFQHFHLNKNLQQMRDVVGLLLLSLFALQPISATFGNLLLWQAGIVPTEQLFNSWFGWWFGNIMAQIIITPTLLALFSTSLTKQYWLKKLFPIAIISIILSWLALKQLPIENPLLIFAITIPLIIIIASHEGMIGSTVSLLIVCISTLYFTHHQFGAFSINGAVTTDNLNLFLGCNALTALFVSASFSQRKLIEQTLRLSDQTLKSIAQGILITDKNKIIISANDMFTVITGYNPFELIGKNCRLLQGELTNKNTIKNISSALDAGNGFSGEILNYRKNGEAFWNDLSITPVYDEHGGLIQFIGITKDITERKKIEHQTNELNQRIVLAAQAIKFGIWELDLTTYDLIWDKRQYDLMWIDAATPANLTYNAWRNRTHPDDLIFVENLLHECINNPNIKFEGKFRIFSPTGELRWVGMGALIDYDDVGKPMRMIGMNWDITKAVLAEQTALNAQAQLQSVIDAARSFSIISVDRYGIIKLFSTGAEAMLGYSADEVIDKTSPAIFHIESEGIARGEELSKQYGRSIHGFDVFVELARRGLIETREWTYMRKNGTTLPVRLSITAITDIDGTITGFLGIANDISEEKLTLKNLAEAKEAAEQANMAKSQFLANMSHEIRTPMNAILGMVQLLQNTDLTTRQKDYASKTQIAAKSLLIILNDILDFSKVEAGRMELEIRPFQLDHLLRDISVILSTNIGDKNIELILAIDQKIPKSLLGDALRLQQILINLAGNAVKFTDYGEIIISLQSVLLNNIFAGITFSIRDTGIGIQPEHLDKIFEDFSQAEASTTRRFGGTGLGLTISKNLVELMGGTLQVKSELGIGTEFIFTLQLPVDKQYTAINPTNWLPNLPTDRALNVLIVDDNESARQVISSISTSIGWNSDCAASGLEALKLITTRNQENTAYDIIFIDWKMPEMDGWQTTEKIRKLSLGKSTPVIIMVTAHGRELMATCMAENNATLDGFLIKPITASMLFDAVADATSGNSSTQIIDINISKSLRLKDLRILVVEDNLMNQQVAEELLSTEGAIVDLAINGKIGIEKIMQASPQYDVVLMDLQMPDMDGYTATKKIRRLSSNKTLPIIAMTANVMSSDKTACLDAGMNDHIGKPIDLDLLINTVLFYCGKTTPEEFQKAKLAEQSFQTAQSHFTTFSDNADSVIDLDNALQRMGGNSALFIRLIQLFISDTQAMPETLQAHLSNNATSQAADLMHTLKSLSATVGATQLSEFSAHTEKLLRKDTTAFSSQSEQTTLVDKLKNSLSNCIKLLNQIGDKLQAQQPAAELLSKNQDNAAILQSLSDLDALLATGNMRATRIFNALKQDYGVALGDKLNELDEALNQLDFKHALEISRLLRKELS